MVYGVEGVLGNHTCAPPPLVRAKCGPQVVGLFYLFGRNLFNIFS